jgi:hypothetical protein
MRSPSPKWGPPYNHIPDCRLDRKLPIRFPGRRSVLVPKYRVKIGSSANHDFRWSQPVRALVNSGVVRMTNHARSYVADRASIRCNQPLQMRNV